MNKQRRVKIQSIVASLKRTSNALNEAIEEIDSVRNDESYAYDSLPEGLQYSQRGENMEAAIDSLESAYDNILSAISSIEDAKSDLTDAMS